MMVLHNQVPHAQASQKEASGKHIKSEACMQVLHAVHHSWCPLTCLVADLLPSHLQPGRLRIALLRRSMGAHARLPPLRRRAALALSRERARESRTAGQRLDPTSRPLPRAAQDWVGRSWCLAAAVPAAEWTARGHARKKQARGVLSGVGRKV